MKRRKTTGTDHRAGISISKEAAEIIHAYARDHGGLSFSVAVDRMAKQLRTDFREGNWPDELTPEQAAILRRLTHSIDGQGGALLRLLSFCEAPDYQRDPKTGMWVRIADDAKIVAVQLGDYIEVKAFQNSGRSLDIDADADGDADTCGIVSAIAGPGVTATP